ncbi:MAG: hypothetical protein V3W18_04825 [candidate division Zixibacteria bacterium]
MEKKIKSAVIGTLILFLVIAAALVSCDRRHGIDSGALQIANVDDVIVSLSPTQIFLPSPDAVDSVLVVIAVLNSEGVGMPSVPVSVTRSPAIGYLVQPDSTDEQGYTTAIFRAEPGVYGTVNINISAGNKSKEKTLYISGPSEYTMNLNYSPEVAKLIDHDGDPYEITATLVDTTQRGVTGQAVTFSVLNRVGRVSYEDTTITVPYTNSQGQVIALFYNTQQDELNNPDSAIIQAVTSSLSDPDNPIVATVVIPLVPVDNSLTMEAIPTVVFGDGADSTVIRVSLRDTYSHGIAYDTISFFNPGIDGDYNSIAVTGGNGIATVSFTPYPERLGATEIVATYRGGTIHEAIDTVSVTILPIRAISFVTVSLQKQNITANGVDSSSIFITVQDSTGGLIADGTSIYLEHTGTGYLSPTVVQTIDGQSVSTIRAPANIVSGPKVDSIFVWGLSSDSTAVGDTVVVTYIPGLVNELQFVRPESTIVLIAGSGMFDTLQVAAVDINGNPVANGTQVRFINQLPSSSINPPSSPTFDGIATAIYLVGSETGDDNVRAFVPDPEEPSDTIWSVQPVVFRCLSAEATTLVLTSSQDNIEVGGASCQIIATLEDAFGNPLSEGYVVAFEIKSANGGQYSPDEWPSFDTEWGVHHDTIETNINGRAVLQIYSGVVAGAVSIEACTIPLPPDSLYVCDEKSLITISSGPPAFVSVSPTPVGEANNPDNPERYVQVGAGVWDIYANPVEYGTAVYFTLIPNDVAEIEGNSYTGGSRPYHADSVGGWAFSRIIYGCYGTFDTLQVVASSAGENGPVADTSAPFALPAYNPSIFITANPGNLRCSGPGSFNCDQSDITALLTDGGGCAVRFGRINFGALVAGAIIGPTEVITDEFGIAETEYEICGDEIPTPPDGVPRIETMVRATLFGYPDVEAVVDLVCTRPQ